MPDLRRPLGLAALLGVLATGAPSAAAGSGPQLIVTSAARVSGPSPYPPTCDAAVSAARGFVLEPHLAVDPARPSRQVVAWQQDRYYGSRGLRAAASSDGGRTHSGSALGLTTCDGGRHVGAADDVLSFGPDGVLYHAAIVLSAGGGMQVVVQRSEDGGRTWGRDVAVSGPGIHDKEHLLADPHRPGHVFLAWFDTAQQALVLSESVDGAATWSPAQVVRAFAPGTYDQATTLAVLDDGTLLLGYFEATVDDQPLGYFVQRRPPGAGAFAPRVLLGVPPITAPVDPDTGDAVAVGLPGALVAGGGRTAHVAWSTAGRGATTSPSEVVVTTTTDGGRTWSRPLTTVRSSGAVALPTPAVDVDGRLALAYYDFAPDRAGDGVLSVQLRGAARRGSALDGGPVGPVTDLGDVPSFAGVQHGHAVGDYLGFAPAGRGFAVAAVLGPPFAVNGPTDVLAARLR